MSRNRNLTKKPPLVSLNGAVLSFGDGPLFGSINLALYAGDLACLVGRNAAGKSTLLRVIAGEIALDAGEHYVEPDLRIAYLPQETIAASDMTVADFVAQPLGKADRHLGSAVLDRMQLDGKRRMGSLSGGEVRRAALARVLAGDPDLLLLDEPTNHLDLPTILWLEQTLKTGRAATLVISHDRAFLTSVTRRTLWLNRGALRVNEGGFGDFDNWVDLIAEEDAREVGRLRQKLKAEQHWLERGITARRRRNQGRLAKLSAMRDERRALLADRARIKVAISETPLSGRLAIEVKHIAKSYGPVQVIRDFSTRIQRGDRIGLIGPNGAGKTTLLKMLIGELAPDSGQCRVGTNLRVSRFHQGQESLDLDLTLWRTLVPGGGDSLMVRGRQRHVVGYLREFSFSDKQAKGLVKTLSGGERNRLMLARLLAKESNLLVLDEPTNDLDMETLDLLLDVLDGYDGTLLIASHDRDFLDRLVTSTIALDGNGGAVEFAGGYSDSLRQGGDPVLVPAVSKVPSISTVKRRHTDIKLSYKDERELTELSALVSKCETTKRRLQEALTDPDAYAKDPEAYARTAADLAETQRILLAAEERWLELEARREALMAGQDKGKEG